MATVVMVGLVCDQKKGEDKKKILHVYLLLLLADAKKELPRCIVGSANDESLRYNGRDRQRLWLIRFAMNDAKEEVIQNRPRIFV